jgi:hypothetical protein
MGGVVGIASGNPSPAHRPSQADGHRRGLRPASQRSAACSGGADIDTAPCTSSLQAQASGLLPPYPRQGRQHISNGPHARAARTAPSFTARQVASAMSADGSRMPARKSNPPFSTRTTSPGADLADTPLARLSHFLSRRDHRPRHHHDCLHAPSIASTNTPSAHVATIVRHVHASHHPGMSQTAAAILETCPNHGRKEHQLPPSPHFEISVGLLYPEGEQSQISHPRSACTGQVEFTDSAKNYHDAARLRWILSNRA